MQLFLVRLAGRAGFEFWRLFIDTVDHNIVMLNLFPIIIVVLGIGYHYDRHFCKFTKNC